MLSAVTVGCQRFRMPPSPLFDIDLAAAFRKTVAMEQSLNGRYHVAGMAIPTSDMPGHRALHDRVTAALDTCVESQSVEFKESAAWRVLELKIVRTALAMANLRDGGLLIIGVGERGTAWDVSGISDEHLTTYDVDHVVETINRFASPPVAATMVTVSRNERRFLAIQIYEFGDTPIVCRRDGAGLRQGAVYVRPPGISQTTEIRSAEQMHDLLELAAEKRARRILETARRIGLEMPPSSRPFDEELGGL
ncbi:MAG TPA: ATP-binding protein [Thermoanaerobaculia bacterium]